VPPPAGRAEKTRCKGLETSFADLLKIPIEPPEVTATVHGTKEEEGLVIENVSWRALDNDTAPAFVVRPAKTNGRLPAIICLHGSSTNGEEHSTEVRLLGVDRYGLAGRSQHCSAGARAFAARLPYAC
jgi:hypothetical protein